MSARRSVRRRGRGWLIGRLPLPITHVVPIEHVESPAVVRRRRLTVSAVSLLGTTLLNRVFSSEPGSKQFYALTGAVAATWTAGGILSGPLHLGWIEHRDRQLRRPVLTPVATGVSAFGFFYGCALVARRIPVLDKAVTSVLAYAEASKPPAVLAVALINGVGEEIFFRGALYSALGPKRPVVTTTALYTAATTSTRNPALVLAATVMGGLFSLQRRASRGVQAPLLTHTAWSTLMVLLLPRLLRRTNRRPEQRVRVANLVAPQR